MSYEFEVPTRFDESKLPPQLPADRFSYPFYAKVFGIVWNDISIEDLKSAITNAVDDSGPLELFQQEAIFNNIFELDADKKDADIEWQQPPDEYEVDEEGIIRAVIGTVQGYKEALLEVLDDDDLAENLADQAYVALSSAERRAKIFRGRYLELATYPEQLAEEFARRAALREAYELQEIDQRNQPTLF